MLLVNGNIWDFWKKGSLMIVPTNNFVKNNGEAVMGAGIAKVASNLYPELPKELGTSILETGGHVTIFYRYLFITFPVKDRWWDMADFDLIERSAQELSKINIYHAYLPRVGCGNGQRKWAEVKPILEKYLDDRFVLVTPSWERD